MTVTDVRDMLRRACQKAGSALAWAKANGFSAPYVSDVLNGRRDPAPRICEALGVVAEVTYRKRKVNNPTAKAGGAVTGKTGGVHGNLDRRTTGTM